MNKKYIFVLGTGRCGTLSMAALLNSQKGVNVTHERNRMSWEPDSIALGIAIERLNRRDEMVVGDCGFWYLNYIKILSNYKFINNTYFVCLKRDREETIDSYMAKTPDSNNWTAKDSKYFDKSLKINEEWYRCYPHYGLPKREAIEKYYNEYYGKVEKLTSKVKNLMTFDMNKVLNTEDGQRELFEFLELDGVPNIGIHHNKGRNK